MGFRGERKRNPHPNHILSYSETSPKERGNVVTENQKKPPPFTHTPLSRTSSPRGSIAKEKCEPDRQVSVARAMRNERRMTRVRR